METKEIATYIIIIIIGVVVAQHMNVVVSGSMEPVLYRGDIVIIDTNPNYDNIQVGDIIVYKATWFNQPVIHRVIKKGLDQNGKPALITKGDNNPAADPYPVYPHQIISKVVSINGSPMVIPKIGYITLWIRGL